MRQPDDDNKHGMDRNTVIRIVVIGAVAYAAYSIVATIGLPLLIIGGAVAFYYYNKTKA